MDPHTVLGYWDSAAIAYQASRADGPLALSSFYEPVVLELVGEVAARRVLDAGCGDGHLARALAAAGALVTAVDGSSQMLALAAAHGGDDGIEYNAADLTRPLPMPDGSFDVIVANMVLMDLPDIDIVMSEFARVLSRSGRFVFSLTHPCFFVSDWVHDEAGGKRHKAIVDYLAPTVERMSFWGTTLHFHRPLSAYFDALARAGFVVDDFKEPVPSEAQVERRPEWRHHRRVPSFVVARALRR